MSLPPDPELQKMSDAELSLLWEKRPKYAETAGDMDWIRVAKELRYRHRHNESKRYT